MGITLGRSFVIPSLLFFVSLSPGLSQRAGRDSVAIIKPKVNKTLYNFEDNGAKEIQIVKNKAQLARYTKNEILRDMGNNALTSLIGIGFGSATEGRWNVSGTIQCNDTLNDWDITMFCEGYVQKERERVRDNDGSWSVETQESNVYSWDKEASGIIIENSDTIGTFRIIMSPLNDSLLKPWSEEILKPLPDDQDTKPKTKWVVSWKQIPGHDYAIAGIFRDKDFFFIFNGNDHKVWMSIDNVLKCIFQSDLNYPGLKKKDRKMPYLLINNTIAGQDRRDLFRLAIVSCFMNNYLAFD
jgi:hypothetical protein